MKNLYIIGGTMGVGKTTVRQLLKKKLPKAVFLDGDWCWDADPFQVNNETKEMVMQNICFLLNQFIHCPAYENIIFCWVLPQQDIIDTLLANIDQTNCSTKLVSLTCDSATLINRLKKDIKNGQRTDDIVKRSLERIPWYNKLKTVKIDTTNYRPEEICDKIIAL